METQYVIFSVTQFLEGTTWFQIAYFDIHRYIFSQCNMMSNPLDSKVFPGSRNLVSDSCVVIVATQESGARLRMPGKTLKNTRYQPMQFYLWFWIL